MVDALEPAVEAYSAAADAGKDLVECLRQLLLPLRMVKATIPLVAKGRAYLGERSVGHQDPGRHRQSCFSGQC